MTTKELISKAYEIASKYFDVKRIDFEQAYDFIDLGESMCITCFYIYKGESKNYSAYQFSTYDNFSAEYLLRTFKKRTKEVHRQYFPDAPDTTTTDLTIEP